ncbi:MAG: ABC transporter permease subunit, partial [Planctomycetes bacterium]|nr:ABC transporter permease subunit [Planctomycetota bacterium]
MAAAIPSVGRWERAEARRGATALPAASADSSLPVGKDDILTPLLLSMRVSFVAVLLILVPGTMIGVWLARTRSRWRPLVEAVSIAPLVVPPVVTGFVLLMVMHTVRFPPVFTWWAAAVAAGVVAMPLLIRTVRSSVEQIDPRLANVAKTLGASRTRVLY